MFKTSTLTWAIGAALIATPALTTTAHAQRDREDRQEQRGERRERIQNMTPAQRQQWLQQRQAQRAQRRQNMTPAQRQEAEQQQQERQVQREQAKWVWVRQTLTAAGYTDAEVQSAVVSFMQAQEKARQPLQQQARALATGLIDLTTPNEKLTADLTKFREAASADQKRYQTELAELDTKVKFSTQPRLETLLTILGVIGQETPTLGGVGAIFPTSPMGSGGMRGGGGRGGAGGQRGN